MPSEFEEAKRRRESNENSVRCAHCGAWIYARSQRCEKCGTHFLGEAFQFVHERDELNAARGARRRRAMIAGVVLILLLLAGTTLYFVA